MSSAEGDQVKSALDKMGKGDLEPIFHLDDDGHRLFSIVVDYLDDRGLIESVDVITCTMLAKSLALYIAVARHVHGFGDVIQVYPNGTSNVSGAFTALSKAQDQVLKLSAKLGLSPMDRSRILGAASNAMAAKDKSQQGDDIDDLM
jgi:P27 family predicted phage terminase small subunit